MAGVPVPATGCSDGVEKEEVAMFGRDGDWAVGVSLLAFVGGGRIATHAEKIMRAKRE